MTPARSTPRPALAVAAALVLLAGCATGPDADPKDPLEPLNRGVYRFNDAIDTAVLKPVATAYVDITPSPVRTGVNNFFSNLGDLWSAVNAGLQLRPRETADNLLRFGVNTVLGFGGLLDIAGEAGIPRTRIDFGQTLGRWGVPSGAYVVLPFFGPSTVRDTGGLVVDWEGDLVDHVNHIPTRNSLYALRVVDTRAGLLRAGELFEGAALDKYSLMRDFYLGRRQRQIDDMIDKGIGTGDGE
ncbi:VacJ family lipoprotein [Hydrogenophaga sp. YM1]|mgnify:FL=1|jgi:phospholipid-binding lipoprotein MlaA|uniref:MlaA family lipoprotein n=1 Tax=unclassified Hydrogenophaga TaxID=2610897 RepID=UPI0008695C0D|nr:MULTISPECIES: VacJ family lipoprotein [unclassified Hydrogenophaga]MBN9372197.1 VacJ family lipoprotein [Hydrogenophaga sp.]ODT34155.1 MAG: ABC transporter [Hydrogenophaga sp. SCN 70-13]OJV62817.1 MAG: ABC transporter [Hydrogenophaga sp. 70-12]QRR35208.1 VacJ family lipoprotein [Hydrogenophaga sp. YM1]